MPLPSMTQGVQGRYAPVRQGISSTQMALGDSSMAPPAIQHPVLMGSMNPPAPPAPPMAPPAAPPPPMPAGVAPPPVMPGSPLQTMRQRFQPVTQPPRGLI